MKCAAAVHCDNTAVLAAAAVHCDNTAMFAVNAQLDHITLEN